MDKIERWINTVSRNFLYPFFIPIQGFISRVKTPHRFTHVRGFTTTSEKPWAQGMKVFESRVHQYRPCLGSGLYIVKIGT
jgi:hypothetical protein